MTSKINTLIIGSSLVLCAYLLGNAIINRNKSEELISVSGLGKSDFESDLIVWEGNFSKYNVDLKQAYSDLNTDKSLILNYLKSKKIADSSIVFQAVSTTKKNKSNYSLDGRYVGEEFLGYNLEQSFKIESKDVDKVEKLSREITELLNQGVQLYSQSPRYYYTKIEDLKIAMVSKASENAKLRAVQIAKNSNGDLGQLSSAKMGVFQITGQNSKENHSWGGTFNTSSRKKSASITMKLTYKID